MYLIRVFFFSSPLKAYHIIPFFVVFDALVHFFIIFFLYFFFVVREYAHIVRQQVESLGVLVEIRQLSPTMSLVHALSSASTRGCLYTIIITSQHETHRSVTLTILHGRNPQGLLMASIFFFQIFPEIF